MCRLAIRGLCGLRVGRSAKQLKPTPTVLSDRLTGPRVVEIDQHVLIGMPRQIVREDLNKLLLIVKSRFVESFSVVELVRPAVAVEARPELNLIAVHLVEPR